MSTSLTSVLIYHHYLLTGFMSFSLFVMQEHTLHMKTFLKWGKLRVLTNTFKQEYWEPRLKSSLRKVCGQYNALANNYSVSLRHMLTDVIHTCKIIMYTPEWLRFLRFFLTFTMSTRWIPPVGKGCKVLQGTKFKSFLKVRVVCFKFVIPFWIF